MYEYRAKIIAVHDGDTCTAVIDLGFRIAFEMKLRLKGINAPELSGAAATAGAQSRDWLAGRVLNRSDVTVRTDKDRTEKYGRYLATLLIDGAPVSVNDEMVARGLAVPYMT
jgi:micrococcal nuclease